jgi:hypothetical protein
LVEFERGASLLNLGCLFEDLKETLQMDVDIVTYAGLKNGETEFAENVLREAQVIYDANLIWTMVSEELPSITESLQNQLTETDM